MPSAHAATVEDFDDPRDHPSLGNAPYSDDTPNPFPASPPGAAGTGPGALSSLQTTVEDKATAKDKGSSPYLQFPHKLTVSFIFPLTSITVRPSITPTFEKFVRYPLFDVTVHYVLPKILPIVFQSEFSPDDCKTLVTSERLNKTFAYHSVYAGERMHKNDLFPQGPKLVVNSNSLGEGHSVRKLTTRASKALITFALSTHACTPECPVTTLVFHPLKKDRKTKVMSEKAKGKQRAVQSDPVGERHGSRSNSPSESCGSTVDDVRTFPKIASTELRHEIIKDWQNVMNYDELTRHPCAVCAQCVARRDILYILPDEVDFTLLQNHYLPPDTLPRTYNLAAYDGAILYPLAMHNTEAKDVIEMCSPCHTSLVVNGKQPLNSLANFQYYAIPELPPKVKEAFSNASMFDIMLVSRARSTKITHLYSSKKQEKNKAGKPASYPGIVAESQGYSKGNIAIMPQDTVHMRQCLPPGPEEIKRCMCAVFSGGDIVPTRENIEKLAPMMVTKDIVHSMLEFLLSKNTWYRASGVAFDPDNLAALYEDELETEGDLPDELVNGEDEHSTHYRKSGIPAAVELCHLPSVAADTTPASLHDPSNPTNDAEAAFAIDYVEREDAFDSGEGDVLMESVGYTDGDFTPKNFRHMKATALSWCLDGNKFIRSGSGSELLCDHDPGLLSFLFPALDPWGIGDFCATDRRPDQFISFDKQVRNLLRQHNSPFQKDPSFPYVCWNIMQKRVVNRQASFKTSSTEHHTIAKELNDAAPALTDMIQKWEKDPEAKPSCNAEKKAMALLNKVKLVAKEIRGSSGYKQCRRNEIRALMKKLCTPALFVTINPSDIHSPLVGVMAGVAPEEWRNMDAHARAIFVAKNPGPASQFFDYTIQSFVSTILRYGDPAGGLFGNCNAYYGMVEAQGRGTLHCHMLIWLDGNPSPQELRDNMRSDANFQSDMFSWLESIIQCELPGTTEVQPTGKQEGLKPRLKPGDIDPRIQAGPILREGHEEEFAEEFTEFVRELALACNWHKHKRTCWIHLKRGEKESDANCRMRIDGSTRALTEIDPESESILLRRLHPRINNFNDLALFLLKCNMDIKYIGSGEAAKALVYYVSDYITKSSLAVHVGLGALSYAIQQNGIKFAGNNSSFSKVQQDRSLFTKTVNAMMAKQETSHQQIYSYLTGGGDYYCSHKFELLRYGEFDRYLRKGTGEKEWIPHRREQFEADDAGDNDTTQSSDATVRASEEVLVPIDETLDSYTLNDDENVQDEIRVHVEPGFVTQPNDVDDYILRSDAVEFEPLNLYEYVGCVKKILVTKEESRLKQRQKTYSEGQKPRGRTALPRGLFAPDHPQCKTHMTTLRYKNKPHIPVILGRALPRPDFDDAEYEQFSRSMLILFKPWRTPTDLKGEHESWTAAYRAYNFSPASLAIIKNMNIERQCQDAKLTSEEKKRAERQANPVAPVADMNSFGVMLQNDSRLTDGVIDMEFGAQEGVQHTSNIKQVSPLDRLVGDAMEVGVISSNRLSNFAPGAVVGKATVHNEDDVEELGKQSQFMSKLKKNKRPVAPVMNEESVSDGRYLKKRRLTKAKATIGTLSDNVQITMVKPRDANSPDPVDEIERIIDETGIGDNEDQERAFRIAGEHFVSGSQEQLFLYVMGIGGSGKSYVINALVTLFARCGASDQMLLSAPTGSAAVLIGGYTIHALTFLPANQYPVDQVKLESIWRYVKYLVIDEISMVSPMLLSQISRRMCEAKSWDPSASEQPFGGVNVIFTGDFGQLAPVTTYCLFSYKLINQLSPNVSETYNGQAALHGAYLWRLVNNVVELRKNFRAARDPQFVNLLQRIRSGIAWRGNAPHTADQKGVGPNYEYSDFDVLRSRRADVLHRQGRDIAESFKDAPIIVAEKATRDRLNYEMAFNFAKKTNQELHVYHSQDSMKRQRLSGMRQHLTWQVGANITGDHIGLLPLVPGMKVTVTDNAAMSARVVNGAEGILRDITYEIDSKGLRFAVCAYVHIAGCGLQIDGLEYEVVPILPIRTGFKYGGSKKDAKSKGQDDGEAESAECSISRSQLPLLPAYAFIDYKIQGRSLDRVIIDLHSCRSLQSAYVMLSRAKSLEGVMIMRFFNPELIYKSLSDQFETEFERLKILESQTTARYRERDDMDIDGGF